MLKYLPILSKLEVIIILINLTLESLKSALTAFFMMLLKIFKQRCNLNRCSHRTRRRK